MISPSSFTDLAGADLTSAGFNTANFGWFSTSLTNGAAALPTDTTAAPDSFQNVFAQVSSPAPAQPAPTLNADYTQPNTASPLSAVSASTGPAVSSGPANSGPVASPADSSGVTASASPQNPDRSTHKSGARGVPPQITKQLVLHLGSTSVPATTPTPGAHTPQNVSAANPSAPAPDQAANTPSSNRDGKDTYSSSAAPQNALPVSAANALGGLQNLSGAAFALHITVGPNQGVGPNQAASNQAVSNQAVPNQAVPNQAHAAQDAGAQANAGQGNANQAGQNQDGPAPGANPAANTPTTVSPADPQALLQTSNLAALSPWTASPSAATPPTQSAPPTALGASVATGEIDSEDPAGVPQTVRSVQVQLTGEGEGRVDLRLVEHAGGLSVSVRASDSTLTKGLQDNLPELSARLAEEKYQTHTFLPAANEAGGSSSSSSEQFSGQTTEDQSSGRSFSQGHGGGQADGGQTDGRQTGGQSGGQPGGQSGSQSDSGQSSDSGAAWRRQMAALGAFASAVSNSLPGSQAFGSQSVSQPISQSANS